MRSITLLVLFVFSAVTLIPPSAVMAAGSGDSADRRRQMRELVIGEIEFKDAKIRDAVRVISELTGINIVSTRDAGEAEVTIFARDLSVADLIDSICRVSGLWYRFNSNTGVFIIMTTDEYQRDIIVYRDERTRSFKLKYLNVGLIARSIEDLYPDRAILRGKADRYTGDDYDVFQEDVFETRIDEGQIDSSASNNSRSDRYSSGYRGGRRSSQYWNSDRGSSGLSPRTIMSEWQRANQIDPDLSPGRIDTLERATKSDLEVISEGMVSQVRQRGKAPIYVTVNRQHNMLMVRTSDEQAMEQIAELIAISDQQVPEVLLEMKILAVDLDNQFESAFDISQISGSQQNGPDDGQLVNPLNPEATSVGSSLLGLGNFGLVENSTLVFQSLSNNLRVRIQLLEQSNNIKILATPMLMAANNRPARLFIGEETVLTTGYETTEISSGTLGGTTIINQLPVPVTEVVPVGNKLTILPSINADRSVVMRLITENSTIQKSGGQIPLVVDDEVQQVAIDTVDTSTLEGTVLAQDGMTIAVGGMMRTTYAEAENKVPVLGDIPLLGFFFKEQAKVERKMELVLLITPHVLIAPTEAEFVSRSRVGELTEHPSPLDEQFEELEEFRKQREMRRSSQQGLESDQAYAGHKKEEKAAEISISQQQRNFVAMTKTAIKQVRKPYLMRQPEDGVSPIRLRALGELPIFDDKRISATAVAAWTNTYHFITAVRITNHSPQPVTLDASAVRGRWRAATLESQQLAAAKEDGDTTYLYLISDERFETIYSKKGEQ